MKYWIQTQSGVAFDLADPKPEMVVLEDIAQALAFMPRFNGHTGNWYSVAQHSVLVSRLLPKEHRMWGLMHDAHEAYTGDIVSPLKALLVFKVKEIEKRIQDAICMRFDISRDPPLCVHEADLQMLATERDNFFEPLDWGIKTQPLDIDIDVWHPNIARGKFIWEFDRILKGAI